MSDLRYTAPPKFWETPDLEGIHAEVVGAVDAGLPGFKDLSFLDPGRVIVAVVSGEKARLINGLNAQHRRGLLAYADGLFQDAIGVSLWGTQRKLIEEGDPLRQVEPVWESDTAYHRRILADSGKPSVAGPGRLYLSHGLSAHPKIKDINALSPDPSVMHIVVMGHEGNGAPSQILMDAVKAQVDPNRPQCSRVLFFSCEVIEYAIDVTIRVSPGLDTEKAKNDAEEALAWWANHAHRIGFSVGPDTVNRWAGTHIRDGQPVAQTTILDVTVNEPQADLGITDYRAPYATSFNVTMEVAD